MHLIQNLVSPKGCVLQSPAHCLLSTLRVHRGSLTPVLVFRSSSITVSRNCGILVTIHEPRLMCYLDKNTLPVVRKGAWTHGVGKRW